ncbi:hypothetical protein HMPREF0061_0865, partial [Aerococcus viridans ATCC 11563 = CCUG 4311]
MAISLNYTYEHLKKRLGQNYFCEKSSPTFVYFYKDIEKYTPTTEQK